MTTLEGIGFGESLSLEAWSDPVVEMLGYDPRSVYVEKFWLPILGPSTTWLMRFFAAQLEQSPEGCVIEVTDAARCLGLGERSGRHAPFLRTIARAIDFEMAALRGSAKLAVRRSLPPLGRRQLNRLPVSLHEEHERLTRTEAAQGLHLRGRRLALSLLKLGESDEETERQLIRWRFAPTLARQCTHWARTALIEHPSLSLGASAIGSDKEHLEDSNQTRSATRLQSEPSEIC